MKRNNNLSSQKKNGVKNITIKNKNINHTDPWYKYYYDIFIINFE